MQLVKQMREAQKAINCDDILRKHSDAHAAAIEILQRSKALEKRVDEEIAAAERQELANDHDCIRMANGQTLRQGNLFEDQ